jgi:hypothetical protein
MANVAVQYSATFQDELGTEGSTYVNSQLADTTTLSALADLYGTWATDVAAVSDSKLIRGSVRILQPVSSREGTPAAGNRIEQTGVVNFKNASTPHRSPFVIPGLANAVITSGKLDLTNVDVEAIVTLLTAGGFGNSAGQAFTAIADAILSFRKRRKQLSRSSFEV